MGINVSEKDAASIYRAGTLAPEYTMPQYETQPQALLAFRQVA
jgi:hypothetical protein